MFHFQTRSLPLSAYATVHSSSMYTFIHLALQSLSFFFLSLNSTIKYILCSKKKNYIKKKNVPNFVRSKYIYKMYDGCYICQTIFSFQINERDACTQAQVQMATVLKTENTIDRDHIENMIKLEH